MSGIITNNYFEWPWWYLYHILTEFVSYIYIWWSIGLRFRQGEEFNIKGLS
jgi:hypothetical protein